MTKVAPPMPINPLNIPAKNPRIENHSALNLYYPSYRYGRNAYYRILQKAPNW